MRKKLVFAQKIFVFAQMQCLCATSVCFAPIHIFGANSIACAQSVTLSRALGGRLEADSKDMSILAYEDDPDSEKPFLRTWPVMDSVSLGRGDGWYSPIMLAARTMMNSVARDIVQGWDKYCSTVPEVHLGHVNVPEWCEAAAFALHIPPPEVGDRGLGDTGSAGPGPLFTAFLGHVVTPRVYASLWDDCLIQDEALSACLAHACQSLGCAYGQDMVENVDNGVLVLTPWFDYYLRRRDIAQLKKATANVYWFDGRIKRVVFPVLVAVRNHCHVLVHRHTVIQHICIFVCKTDISAQKNTILRKLMCFAHNIPISRTIGCFAQNRFDFTQHTTHHS